ncbi:MAG: hypothetical protein PHE96_10540 [Methylococcales bacterium]|nr:hypothetical protein [Methylococcales bacterium]
MTRFVLSLVLIAHLSSVCAASFAERVATAKEIESQKEADTYFKNRMFPAIGSLLGNAMKACTALPYANLEKFAVVADVTQTGKFINIDYQPRTNTAACVAEAVTGFYAPPPPTCESGDLPIVIEMSVVP